MFVKGHDPRRNTAAVFKPGHANRWMPGQSGNPRGVTATRAKFQQLYVECLAGGTDKELLARARELSDLAWKAARAGESWGFQEVRGQLAPLIAQAQVKLVHEAGEMKEFDPSRLTDAELDQFVALMDAARAPVIEIEGEVIEDQQDQAETK